MAEDTTVTSFGLSVEQLNIINRILTQAANVQSAYLFGSRAKGTNKPASDIDLAIKGIGIQKDDIAALWAAFEESNLPFFVDVRSYEAIRNQELKDHIDRVGIQIYPRSNI